MFNWSIISNNKQLYVDITFTLDEFCVKCGELNILKWYQQEKDEIVFFINEGQSTEAPIWHPWSASLRRKSCNAWERSWSFPPRIVEELHLQSSSTQHRSFLWDKLKSPMIPLHRTGWKPNISDLVVIVVLKLLELWKPWGAFNRASVHQNPRDLSRSVNHNSCAQHEGSVRADLLLLCCCGCCSVDNENPTSKTRFCFLSQVDPQGTFSACRNKKPPTADDVVESKVRH